MRLKRWLLDLVTTVKTKRCLLQKSQASSFLGHFSRGVVIKYSAVNPLKHISPQTLGSLPLKKG
jgi:hypothetical protein